MTDDKSREAFERTFTNPPFEWNFIRQGIHEAWPGSYRHYHIHCAWEGWKAALRYRDEQEKQA